jgi:hypothetical protein
LGCDTEFFVRVVEQSAKALRPTDYEQTRNSLLRRIQDEAAEASSKYQEMRSALESLSEAKSKVWAKHTREFNISRKG